MSCDCTFEPKINVDCALEILRIVRSGDLIASKADLLKHAGCLIGCLGVYLDDQTEPHLFTSAPVDLPCTLEECCDEIEDSIDVSDGPATFGAAAISPAMVALLLKLAELLIAKFLK